VVDNRVFLLQDMLLHLDLYTLDFRCRYTNLGRLEVRLEVSLHNPKISYAVQSREKKKQKMKGYVLHPHFF